MNGKRITDLERVKSVSDENVYLVGTESGDRHIQHKDLVESIEKALPIGDMEELEKLEKLEDQEEQPSVKEKFTIVKAILKVLGVATTVFKGTDGIKSGAAGLVPPVTPADKGKVLGAEGKWVTTGSGSGGEVAAENVQFSDGKTAEEKLGMIDGATDDLNCENDRMVAKMVAVKQLNDSLKFPDGTQFYPDIQDGKHGFNTDPERGADTFFPFSSDFIFKGKMTDLPGGQKLLTMLGDGILCDYDSGTHSISLNGTTVASGSGDDILMVTVKKDEVAVITHTGGYNRSAVVYY